MEVVIVPLHRRAHFALACLTRLYLAARDDVSLTFHIVIDANPTRDVVHVARQFARQVGEDRARVIQRTRTFRGNSYNVLTAYGEVIDSGADVIHLVEEDVLIGKDYFDYHRQVRAAHPDVFAVCACRNQFWALGQDPPADEDAFYLQDCYQSIGISFTPDKLRHVTDHNPRSFCLNSQGYLRRYFPAPGSAPSTPSRTA